MIALIDGDILTYRIGFASQDVEEGIVRSRVDGFMTDLLLYTADCEDYEGYITGSNNYRHDIAITAKYKGNRKQDRPKYYDFIRDYLVDHWGFKMVNDQEADDAIGIEAYTRWQNNDKDYLICTIDKDLDMIPGLHYNFVKNERYSISEFEGLVKFYTQILTGDRVDNIIGLRGIGPAKAAAILKGCKTEFRLYQSVCAAYEQHNEPLSRLLENGRLLWIRRRENEMWEPPTEDEEL